LRAIETAYAGCRFRSRLEARWAVVFDELGYDWQYEPEGFEREWCGETIRYLPDFYLPEFGTWVEVKGSQAQLEADWERMEIMLDWGSPLPGVTESWKSTSRGLLILGGIPRPVVGGYPAFPLIQHHEGLFASTAILEPDIGPWAGMFNDWWDVVTPGKAPSMKRGSVGCIAEVRGNVALGGAPRRHNDALEAGRSERFGT
jgi:hypothetical protein